MYIEPRIAGPRHLFGGVVHVIRRVEERRDRVEKIVLHRRELL
jgi:hypothetical protein